MDCEYPTTSKHFNMSAIGKPSQDLAGFVRNWFKSSSDDPPPDRNANIRPEGWAGSLRNVASAYFISARDRLARSLDVDDSAIKSRSGSLSPRKSLRRRKSCDFYENVRIDKPPSIAVDIPDSRLSTDLKAASTPESDDYSTNFESSDRQVSKQVRFSPLERRYTPPKWKLFPVQNKDATAPSMGSKSELCQSRRDRHQRYMQTMFNDSATCSDHSGDESLALARFAPPRNHSQPVEESDGSTQSLANGTLRYAVEAIDRPNACQIDAVEEVSLADTTSTLVDDHDEEMAADETLAKRPSEEVTSTIAAPVSSCEEGSQAKQNMASSTENAVDSSQVQCSGLPQRQENIKEAKSIKTQPCIEARTTINQDLSGDLQRLRLQPSNIQKSPIRRNLHDQRSNVAKSTANKSAKDRQRQPRGTIAPPITSKRMSTTASQSSIKQRPKKCCKDKPRKEDDDEKENAEEIPVEQMVRSLGHVHRVKSTRNL